MSLSSFTRRSRLGFPRQRYTFSVYCCINTFPYETLVIGRIGRHPRKFRLLVRWMTDKEPWTCVVRVFILRDSQIVWFISHTQV
jgi:hypothetical protein